MLQVNHVTKKYGKVLANDDISFSVKNGQLAVLLGPNGAGKSTIIKCIAGLLRFQGEILVAGQPNDSLEAKHALGYVPEMPAVYELLTVGEHVEFIRRAYRLGDEANAYADALLERFEMADKRDKLGKELSKGMQQKLSVICALLPRPEVVIFDEPTRGIDVAAKVEIYNLMNQLKQQGIAVMFVSSEMPEVMGIADRIVVMCDGRITGEVMARETTQEEILTLATRFENKFAAQAAEEEEA